MLLGVFLFGTYFQQQGIHGKHQNQIRLWFVCTPQLLLTFRRALPNCYFLIQDNVNQVLDHARFIICQFCFWRGCYLTDCSPYAKVFQQTKYCSCANKFRKKIWPQFSSSSFLNTNSSGSVADHLMHSIQSHAFMSIIQMKAIKVSCSIKVSCDHNINARIPGRPQSLLERITNQTAS